MQRAIRRHDPALFPCRLKHRSKIPTEPAEGETLCAGPLPGQAEPQHQAHVGLEDFSGWQLDQIDSGLSNDPGVAGRFSKIELNQGAVLVEHPLLDVLGGNNMREQTETRIAADGLGFHLFQRCFFGPDGLDNILLFQGFGRRAQQVKRASIGGWTRTAGFGIADAADNGFIIVMRREGQR